MKHRRQVFTDLHAATTQTSFDAAITAAMRMLAQDRDPAGPGLEMLAYRIEAGSEPDPTPVNLTVYDQLVGEVSA